MLKLLLIVYQNVLQVNLITYLMSLIVYWEVKTSLVIKSKNSRNPNDRFTAV